jgi:hypothetical protein
MRLWWFVYSWFQQLTALISGDCCTSMWRDSSTNSWPCHSRSHAGDLSHADGRHPQCSTVAAFQAIWCTDVNTRQSRLLHTTCAPCQAGKHRPPGVHVAMQASCWWPRGCSVELLQLERDTEPSSTASVPDAHKGYRHLSRLQSIGWCSQAGQHTLSKPRKDAETTAPCHNMPTRCSSRCDQPNFLSLAGQVHVQGLDWCKQAQGVSGGHLGFRRAVTFPELLQQKYNTSV